MRSGSELVVCGEELGFGGFPGGGQWPIYHGTLTSLASRNEPRNTSLHNGIEPDLRLDSFSDLPHGVFGKGGDFKVFLDSARSLRGGQEGCPALDGPGEQDLAGVLLTRLAMAVMTGSSNKLGSLLCPSAANAWNTMPFFLQ